jgi:hypothetical protein
MACLRHRSVQIAIAKTIVEIAQLHITTGITKSITIASGHSLQLDYHRSSRGENLPTIAFSQFNAEKSLPIYLPSLKLW